MADGVLDEVEQHALELLRVAAGGSEFGVELGADVDASGLGVWAHGLDRLLDEVIETDLLD